MGEPYFKFKDITQKFDVKIFSSNFSLYGDISNRIKKRLLSVMGAFGEFERALIRERQLEGIYLAKQKGLYNGRKKKLSYEAISELKEKISQGQSKSVVEKEFNISRETLYQYLKYY